MFVLAVDDGDSGVVVVGVVVGVLQSAMIYVCTCPLYSC
jgi:hypothetical protein